MDEWTNGCEPLTFWAKMMNPNPPGTGPFCSLVLGKMTHLVSQEPGGHMTD